MAGILFVEDATVEATTGQMLLTFTSGGEDFRFHLPAHIAIRFRQKVMADGWQVVCAPSAEVVTFKRKRVKGGQK
jgi:hypothetical protein